MATTILSAAHPHRSTACFTACSTGRTISVCFMSMIRCTSDWDSVFSCSISSNVGKLCLSLSLVSARVRFSIHSPETCNGNQESRARGLQAKHLDGKHYDNMNGNIARVSDLARWGSVHTGKIVSPPYGSRYRNIKYATQRLGMVQRRGEQYQNAR